MKALEKQFEPITSIQSPIYCTLEKNILKILIDDGDNKNSFDDRAYNRLADILNGANKDREIYCITISGANGIFCTGNSLAGLAETSKKNRLSQPTRRFLQSLVDNQKPLIACVDGAAIGIGTTMLFHCDYVVATKRSFFHTPFASLYVTLEAASSLLGPIQLGYRKAFQLLCLGERLRASKALEIDLIDCVCENAKAAEEKCQHIATKLARLPSDALMTSRALLRTAIGDMNLTMSREIVQFERCISSPEALRKHEQGDSKKPDSGKS